MNSKIESVFLLMLFAIILIIPIVSADPNQNFSAINLSIQLPLLHFNTSQPKVVVTGDLSPAKNTSPSSGGEKPTIPFGAIIYHSTNITTVFNETGQQMLVADDPYAEIIHTFSGDSPATFIHEVPNNSVIVDGGNILHIFYNDTRILTIIDDNSYPSYTIETATTCYGGPYYFQYIEGTESSVRSSSISQFSAVWNVPLSPHQSNIYQPISIWNGLYSCVEGNSTTGLVQPVLSWNYGDYSQTWTIAPWYVWANSTQPDGDVIIGPIVAGVSVGDNIYGNMQVNSQAIGYDSITSITDMTTGGSSVLALTKDRAPTKISNRNLTPQIVLEGFAVQTQYNSQYLPGPVTFKSFILMDTDGNNLLSTTPMTSFNNSAYWNFPNLTVYNRWPLDITLVNNLNLVNAPVANFNALVTSGHGATAVPFRDLSTGSPFLWLWNFGDGSSSTDPNPTHTYSIPGSFTVNLTVWNAGGINSLVRPNYISIMFVPVPGFIVSADHGTAPHSVQFNDTSIYSPTIWNWSFGDGNYSTARNATHTYSQAGTYNVSLYAANAAGGNTSAKKNINVIPVLKDHIGIFRNSTGYWYLDYNFDQVVEKSFILGTSGDISIVGDWNGNGFSDAGIFRPSTGWWYFDYHLNGSIDKSFRYGGSTDQIIKGDWDGDGKDGIAIFRPSNRYWYFDYNLDGVVDKSFMFGNSTDKIIKGDWDGDGKDGIAVFQPSTGYWSFDYNLDGIANKSFRYGGNGDRIIAGKWNSTLQDGIAIFRNSTGYWYFDYDLDGVVDQSFRYGGATDQITKGDWDADRKDGIAIFRPSTGYWYFDNNLDGIVDSSFRFGGTTDQIIVGKWV